jgi:hypothetical protein
MKLSNRVFWAGTFLAGCTILSGGLVAQEAVRTFAGPIQATAVRAVRFEVVDSTGRVRAQIAARPDGTVYTVGLTVPVPPGGAPLTSSAPPSQAAPALSDPALRGAMADQRRDAELLRLQLDQERLRQEQDRLRRQAETERLRRETERLSNP